MSDDTASRPESLAETGAQGVPSPTDSLSHGGRCINRLLGPMKVTLVRASVVVLVLLCTACGGSSPTSPSGTIQPPTPPPTAAPSPPSGNFPPLSGPSRTFVFDRELSYSVRDYTRNSRFVLYDNGAFVLQYLGRGEYRGAYTETNGVVTFEWEGWSVAGAWGATGSISDDLLSVRYNLIMGLTDFEDAAYLRAQ
jgi:hypothetical protein